MSNDQKPVSSQGPILKGFASKAIHAGYSRKSSEHQPIVPPIINSTAYEYETIDFPKGAFGYSRISNLSREILEKNIAALEDAEYGVCYSSGLAAIFAVFYLLNPGDHAVCPRLLYGGTVNQLRQYATKKGIEISFLHPMDPSSVKKAIKKTTKLVYLETPANPIMTIVDLKSIADLVKSYPEVILAVDSTFMTPYFQKPLNYGADIVVHSLSKYMNGHGDVIMGVAVTNRADLSERLNDILISVGSVPSPMDCSLVSRGLKTLHLRMKEHEKNAFAVAKFLETHPLIEKVLYPGLPSHPQHELAKEMCTGFSGMVSFYIHGDKSDAEKFLKSLKMVTNTGSLGQPHSLICHPASVSHFYVPKDERQQIGITDNLLRISVGLEDEEDIITDLKQALEKLQTK